MISKEKKKYNQNRKAAQIRLEQAARLNKGEADGDTNKEN
jgi:hypothetical protein